MRQTPSDDTRRTAVSIILPTYNRAKFLPQAFASIRSQTFTDWELIVVDDGSTDNTQSLVEEVTRDWPQPVRYHRQPNGGPYAARNTGLDLARGESVAFFDSDDAWHPHHLADCAGALAAHPDVTWVYGSSRIVDAAGAVISPDAFRIDGQPRPFLQLGAETQGRLRVIRDSRAVECAILHGLFCGLQCSVIRRRLFDAYRFETESRNEAEDQLVVVHALKQGSRFGYFDNVHLDYYVHGENSSNSAAGAPLDKRLRVNRTLVERYETLGNRVRLTAGERRALDRRLGREYFWHIGYALLWRNGRRREALGAFRRALRLNRLDWRMWKTYLLARARVAVACEPTASRGSSHVLIRLQLEIVSMYLRRTPWENARWRIIPTALRWACATAGRARWRRVRTRHDFRMRLNLDDWLGRHVFVTGEYEPPTSAVLKALLRPGDTFVDVGANVGYFSLLAARQVGPTGRVVAFEPVPLTRGQLAENVRLNRFGSVTIRDEALSDRPGEVEFFVGPTDHRGTSSLRPLDTASETIRVRTVRLDDLEVPGPVRVVKIDVEGAELLALHGMAAVLRRDHPDLIVELTDSFLRTMGHSAAALCEFVLGFGYRMYVIDHHGPAPADPLRTDLSGQFNVLFTTRPELPPEVSSRGSA